MNTTIEVILIEDNPDDAALVIRTLKKNNLANNLVHLKDGVEALDFILGGEHNESRMIQSRAPKVILLDLKMPRINGMEVLNKIKSDTIAKNIPVVILTSSAEDPDIKRCYELGANSYIVKPVEFDVFSKTISELGAFWILLNHPPLLSQ